MTQQAREGKVMKDGKDINISVFERHQLSGYTEILHQWQTLSPLPGFPTFLLFPFTNTSPYSYLIS